MLNKNHNKKRIDVEHRGRVILLVVLVVLGFSVVSSATPMSRILLDPPVIEVPGGETVNLEFNIYGVNVDPYMPGLYTFQIEDNENTPINDLDIIKDYSVKQPMMVGPMVGRLSTQTTTLIITTNSNAAQGTYKPVLKVVNPISMATLETMEFTIISSNRFPIQKFENITYDFMNIQFLMAPTRELYKHVPADFQVITTANPDVGILLPITVSVTNSPFGPYRAVFLMVPVLQYSTAPVGEEWFYPIYTYTDNPAFKEYIQREWNTDEIELAEIDTKQNIYNDTSRDTCVGCHVLSNPGANRVVEDRAVLKDSSGILMEISGKSRGKDGGNAGIYPIYEKFVHSAYHAIDKNNLSVMQLDRSHTEMQALQNYDVKVKKNSRIWNLIGGNDPNFCNNCHTDNSGIKDHKSPAKQKVSINNYYPHVIRSVSEIDVKETQLLYRVTRTPIPMPLFAEQYNFTFMDSQVFEVPSSELVKYIPPEFPIEEVRPGIAAVRVVIAYEDNPIWGPFSDLQVLVPIQEIYTTDPEHYYIPITVNSYYVIEDYIDNEIALEGSRRLGYPVLPANITHELTQVNDTFYMLKTVVRDDSGVLYSTEGSYTKAYPIINEMIKRFVKDTVRLDTLNQETFVPVERPAITIREGSALWNITKGTSSYSMQQSSVFMNNSDLILVFRYRKPELPPTGNNLVEKALSLDQKYDFNYIQMYGMPTDILSNYIPADKVLLEPIPGIGISGTMIGHVNSSPLGAYSFMWVFVSINQPTEVLLPQDPGMNYLLRVYTDSEIYKRELDRVYDNSLDVRLAKFDFEQEIEQPAWWNISVRQYVNISDASGIIFELSTNASRPMPSHEVHYMYRDIDADRSVILRDNFTTLQVISQPYDPVRINVGSDDLAMIIGKEPMVFVGAAELVSEEIQDFFILTNQSTTAKKGKKK
ncbi:hypothetical protein ANME2D_00900 [Candidatus Methanoperedens nitroreducens]|uniref:Uncharacterized protein n=1 Tax=Candidatus Methanoperedens nitratireducens TaxID=1392998 RepID=A0A062V7G3_9EURY|nr:hypothetical protein [Candidatus Methanoperedens nitroreducens]KCZ72473.1 hypothetical protein ANME2D_00900 [Candidatus Methanoperedens nitroreducens]MDJ1423593.1 hypothetical protein [Candidatus Methanoperedens sp.]